MSIPIDTNAQRKFGPSSWLWLQRPWWSICAFVRALSPARFSLFVALVGGSLFLFVQQGTEILRSLAEPDLDNGRLHLGQIAWFFGALLLWSIQSWYWARALLTFQFPGTPSPPEGGEGEVVRWCRKQGPRFLGVLPLIPVAIVCFFFAPKGYDDKLASSHQAKMVLRLFGSASMAMIVILYGGFILRRQWLLRSSGGSGPRSAEASTIDLKAADEDWSRPRYRHFAEFRAHGSTRWVVLSFFLFSLSLLLNFLFLPVNSGLALGSGAILCLAASTWVCFGSLAVWLSDRLRLPFVGLLVAWAVFCSFWNDNHLVRMISSGVTTSVARPTAMATFPKAHWGETSQGAPVAEAFASWQATLPTGDFAVPAGATKPARPVFIVATEGGGIRAAYWTALVLASLEDRSRANAMAWSVQHPGQNSPPDFASSLFAISGVSGGSLGAVVFDALLAENAKGPLADKAGRMLGQDFLSPTLAAMLFPDLLQRFWPWPITGADRARALETSWEHGWKLAVSGTGENRFEQPFLSLWSRTDAQAVAGINRLPALFLNGTSVETGKRIITSNIGIKSGVGGEFSDAEDAEQEISASGSLPRDLPLSTAAHMSARFTYVSPAGRLPSGGHVVDGGYFENSAATTALEVLYAIEGVIDDHPEWPERLVPVVIEIRNGPVSEPSGEGTNAAPPPKLYKHHEVLGEILDPLVTLLNTRDARGSYSQAAIESEQQDTKKRLLATTLFRFGLYDRKVPLPLGWMLSGGAASEMQSQLRDSKLGNQTTLENVTKLLMPSPH